MTEEEEKELRAGYLALLEDGKINGNKLYHIDLTLSESSERAALETSGFSKLFIERAGGNGINIIARKIRWTRPLDYGIF